MLNLQFGEPRMFEGALMGEFALHVQCPWRIESEGTIVTGRDDFDEVPTVGEFAELIDGAELSLAEHRLRELMGSYDPVTRSIGNASERLVVSSVSVGSCGAAVFELSGGFRLGLFPSGSRSEDWRLFRPTSDAPHFVIVGGTVEED